MGIVLPCQHRRPFRSHPKERVDRNTGRLRERPLVATLTEDWVPPAKTATPQTTYIPPPDSGRRRSRRTTTRGRGGSLTARADDLIKATLSRRRRFLSLEDRIAGRARPSVRRRTKVRPSDRRFNGKKSFAEKLGIKPKDVGDVAAATRCLRHY